MHATNTEETGRKGGESELLRGGYETGVVEAVFTALTKKGKGGRVCHRERVRTK